MGTLSQATSLPGRRPGDAARARRARWRRHLRAHLYVAPAVIPVVVLLYLPFLWTAYLSITRYDGLTPPVRIGLTNYREFLHDPVLATSVRNTLLWVVGTVLLPVGLGLVVAVLTYDLPRGTLWRLPFLLPVAFSGVGVGVVWTFILGHGGAANSILQAVHVPGGGTDFLSYAPQNTVAMIVAYTWQQLGFNMLLFVVGLQSIPRAPLEAARLDGASGWTMFRHMLWPLMRPITTVVLGLALVASLKSFDVVWTMTQGGPGRSSETLAVTIYRDAFVANDYGYGSTVAVLLLAVTGVASLLYLRRQLRSEDQ